MPPVAKTGKMPAIIVLWLMALFSAVLLIPIIRNNEKPSDVILQTLLMLLVAGVSFYIGTTQKSGEKDDTIAKQIPAATTTIPAVTIDTSRTGPVDVKPV